MVRWFIKGLIKASKKQDSTYIESCPVRMRKMQIFFRKIDQVADKYSKAVDFHGAKSLYSIFCPSGVVN